MFFSLFHACFFVIFCYSRCFLLQPTTNTKKKIVPLTNKSIFINDNYEEKLYSRTNIFYWILFKKKRMSINLIGGTLFVLFASLIPCILLSVRLWQLQKKPEVAETGEQALHRYAEIATLITVLTFVCITWLGSTVFYCLPVAAVAPAAVAPAAVAPAPPKTFNDKYNALASAAF